ncbi:N-acetyltransferase family protein [Rhizobium sp. ARZ01]|uniref:GNAT family N-acetyltransferase n=1 Tax=Rhizobium sp. ARZ01 TaxID=2769313 RepID=UPI00178422A1|nr:GNAT family N-acetyltransferase [Rhizobium sp. ARZ01]MBD9371477.1 N-acetyltransferase family protein [Rhizobium sp. ARZ01]
MEQATLIRDAREDDMAAVMEIYNDAVANTTAIWNDTLVDLDNRLEWFRGRRERGFPVVVAELDGKVVGYASYGDWRAFDGYRHTAEHSIYVHKDARGNGIGRLLLGNLIDRARSSGIHVLIAGIESENEASIRLHEGFGFRAVGRFKEVGTKFGRWLDLTCMELCLQRPNQ